jgi:uncharacterized membrane protein YGL010W
MRDAEHWFAPYSDDHRHPTNIAIHWICVPVITWCAIALLWIVPVPHWLGRPGFWSVTAMFVAFAFYFYRLSRSVGLAMAGTFIVLALATEGMYRWLGPAMLGWTALVVFVAAWIGQFIGHTIEGRRPSFLTDLTYLLIGPAWLAGKLLRRFGVDIDSRD